MAVKKRPTGNPVVTFRASAGVVEAARRQALAEEITLSALLRDLLAAHVAERHEEAPAA